MSQYDALAVELFFGGFLFESWFSEIRVLSFWDKHISGGKSFKNSADFPKFNLAFETEYVKNIRLCASYAYKCWKKT